MDDLLTKPISPENLYGCMIRWLGDDQSNNSEDPPSDSDHPCDGDGFPLIESATVLELFTLHYRGYAERIRNTLTIGDQRGSFLLCHNLKGAAGTIGAVRLSRMAEELETLVNQNGRTAEITCLVDEIEVEMERLMQQVERLLATSAKQ